MGPYSNDLRKKVLEAYEKEDSTIASVAKQFSVSINFVWLLLDRYRKTGSVEPKPHGGGQPAKIPEQRVNHLRVLVAEHSDATLEELCAMYKDRYGVEVSTATMSRTLARWRITRKNTPVKFKKGEPIARVLPYPLTLLDETNLEIDALTNDPGFLAEVNEFGQARQQNVAKQQADARRAAETGEELTGEGVWRTCGAHKWDGTATVAIAA